MDARGRLGTRRGAVSEVQRNSRFYSWNERYAQSFAICILPSTRTWLHLIQVPTHKDIA
jgi:hypothetical protein